MIKVSDSARDRILEILKKESKDPKEWFLRISVTSGGCSGLTYQLDFDNELKEGDQVFEDNGVRVVTDLRSYLFVHNSVLHFTAGLNGKGFHFENPNAARTCACGESFSL